jgi:phosphatidylglycerol:prolipoprotein diacylglycerol transferase
MKNIVSFPKSLVVGIFQFRIYGLLITLGVVLIIYIFYNKKQKIEGLKKIQVDDLLFYAILPGVIGARLYHVITDWQLYQNNLMGVFEIWNGGLGIFGAVVGGMFGIYFYSKRNKFEFLKIVDLIAIFVPLGQIIGRMGNLINQEIVGGPTDLPWKMIFNDPADGYHPVFLYEQIGNMILFLIMYKLFNNNILKIGKGNFTLIYIFGYSLVRFVVEFFRTETRVLFNIFTLNQIVCIALLFLVGVIYLYTSKKIIIIDK